MTHIPVRKGYADTPDGQIHYREAGAGRPLLMIHPGPSSGAMFEPVMPLLARRGFRPLAMDLPGYGGSFRIERPTVEDYARSLWLALDALGVQGFDIVGNHGGATVAMAMAAAAEPERVGRLALWGVGHFGGTLTPSPSGVAPPRGQFTAEDVAGFWSNGFRFTRVVSPAFHLRRMIDFLQAGYASAGHGPADVVDHPALAARVRQPVLVMSGEHDEVWESSQIAAAAFPDGRFEAIHDASVYVAEEFPEAFADTVARFLT